MLDEIRAWLNGKQDYDTGVDLYARAGSDDKLLALFPKGKNEFRERRLHAELLFICKNLKEKTNGEKSPLLRTPLVTIFKVADTSREDTGISKSADPESNQLLNPVLYQSCKLAADKHYKETMNTRAILFGLVKAEGLENPNLPHKIEERTKLALDVVRNMIITSDLYQRADYVKINGHLPDQEDQEQNEYDHLADSLVKQTLDNLRKNYNKIKQRESTPQRVALLQKHELNIKKLEKRWHSLKPKL